MNLDNFLLNCLLMGYKTMGIKEKSLQRVSMKQLFIDKKRELLRVLHEYFELGLRADAFGDGRTLSGPNDRLWTGFTQAPYIYFVHRQIKPNKAQTPETPFGSLLNNILQEKPT